MSARCSACSAEIIWRTTDNGKAVPLNAKPEKRFFEYSPGQVRLVDVYLSHFVTCTTPPTAFRKPR